MIFTCPTLPASHRWNFTSCNDWPGGRIHHELAILQQAAMATIMWNPTFLQPQGHHIHRFIDVKCGKSSIARSCSSQTMVFSTSIYQSINLSIYLSIYLYIYIHNHIYIYMSRCQNSLSSISLSKLKVQRTVTTFWTYGYRSGITRGIANFASCIYTTSCKTTSDVDIMHNYRYWFWKALSLHSIRRNFVTQENSLLHNKYTRVLTVPRMLIGLPLYVG